MQSTPAVTRNEMRPVKYHYADSFWCTYIISVISANIAEMGMYPNTVGTPEFKFWNLLSKGQSNSKILNVFSIFHITATYPLDLTKTRLQIQGEASGSKVIASNIKPKNVSDLDMMQGCSQIEIT